MRNYKKLYIDGAWVDALGGQVVDVINPATEKPAGQITLATGADVDRAVAAARSAFVSYSRTTRKERLDLFESILALYIKRQDDLADALTEEMGAPAKFARELQWGIGYQHLQTGIAHLKEYLFEHPQGNRTIVRREPIGVVGMITPWNWPINQIMVKVVPALATGCTSVHKPSEIAPFSAHVLAEIFHEAGVPRGVYNLVDGDGPTVGAAISSQKGIDMVSFTGSTAAGIDVAKRAADSVKRIHQELGGKSPNVVLDDAIAIANDTVYGLSAFVQSASDERAEEVAARIEAGIVYVNGANEDPEAPFGGYKMSGNGREWGEIAFGEFLETKAIIHAADQLQFRKLPEADHRAGSNRLPLAA